MVIEPDWGMMGRQLMIMIKVFKTNPNYGVGLYKG